MLRVKAKQAAYWKAQSLDVFDGERWRQAQSRLERGDPLRAADQPGRAQALHAGDRGLGAQPALAHVHHRRHPDRRARDAPPRGDPQRPARDLGLEPHAAPRRQLHGGRLHPEAERARAARPPAPTTTATSRTSARSTSSTATLPARGRAAGPVPLEVRFPEWDARGVAPEVIRPGAGADIAIERLDGDEDDGALRPAPHVGALEGAAPRRDRRRSTTSSRSRPTSARGFTYTEAPPAEGAHDRGLPVRREVGLLPAVLGRDGDPAADGRDPGARGDRLHVGLLRPQGEGVRRARPRRPLVGRGVVPRVRLGDLRPDAVRGAAALAEQRPRRPGARRRPGPRRRRRGRRAQRRPPPRRARRGRSTPAAACSPRCCSAAALVAFHRRGRRPAPLPELERALRRTRRAPGPGATLQALEASFARSPDAAGYVRALRDQRYGGRGEAPTSAQRRGLRSELGRGGGLLGRLRAWWALPPRTVPAVGRTIDAHG